MLEFKVDTGGLSRALGLLPGVLARGSKDHMESLGLYLIQEVRIDFEEKSRRKQSHGIKWRELSPARERQKARRGGWKGTKKDTPPQSQINVDKGLLRNSATPGFSSVGGKDLFDTREDSVTIGYGMNYAKYVDEDRTLIPDPAPKEWLEEMEQMTKEWLEDEIKKQLGL